MAPRAAPRGIRIAELARRAGVSKPTIQHYVAARLLPRPRKTSRTMAYYDPACIDRVRVIKDLQARYLPLAAIRKVLGPPSGRANARGQDVLQAAGAQLGAILAEAERSLARDEVPAETGLTPDALAGLERVGLVHARAQDGREVFPPNDVAVLRAVAQLNRAGLDRAAGFRPEDLLVYREAVAALMAKEIDLFARHALHGHPADLARTATVAALGATDLIAALHRKLVAEFIAATTSRTPR